MTMLEGCAAIHRGITRLPSVSPPFHDIPADGLYFFYETGETESHEGLARIVRVGNHPHRVGGLKQRLRQHYSGRKNGSVFRKALGGAILRSQDADHPCLLPSPGKGHWEQQNAKTCEVCKPTEAVVSRRLREQFDLKLLRVDDVSERNRLEEALVATLAQCPTCDASPDWLGRRAYSEKIQATGMWNSQFTASPSPMTGMELLRVHELIERSLHRTI